MGTGLPTGTTLTVDIRTDAGPWAHLTGVTVNAQGQFSIADSNFAAGESNHVRVKREDQPDAAYSTPIAVVVDPTVTSSSASTINQISVSRFGTDLKLRWALAAENNKSFKIYFRRADNNTQLDLTPMGLPASSRELSLGSQAQNLPAGEFLATQHTGITNHGGLNGHFEDGTIPPPASTGPVYIVQYHHRDHLGTLRLITDEMGGKLEGHDYETFGVELNPPFGAASRKKYTGHERDESTGLDYMLARYYPAGMGRFLTVDPGFDVQVEAPQSWNPYAYVRNTPLNSNDPTGKWVGADDAIFSIGGAIVGLAGQAVSDLISGKASGWEDYAGAAIGGAAGGEALLYTGPIGAGAVGGATANLAKQGLKNLSGKQDGFDPVSLATDTAVGAATGLIPGAKVPGVTSGKGSFNQVFKQVVTKAESGAISKVTNKTAAKMFVGRAVDTGLVPGAGAGAAAAGSGVLPSSEERKPPQPKKEEEKR